MDDIKHDPDPLLTRMMNLMWRYDKDPSADALVDVLNEAAAEIERLRREVLELQGLIRAHEGMYARAAEQIDLLRGWLERTYRLAVGHGPNWEVFDGWEEAINAYEEAHGQ